MPRTRNEIIEYRRYNLPIDFPLIFLDGERWRISDQTGFNLHFHNCMEIGMCHSDHGTMIIEGEPFEFKAGDVTCLPRNIPHTTFSAPGKASLWTYIFVDMGSLFSQFFHSYSEDFVISGTNTGNFRYLMEKNLFPKISSITACVIDELRARGPNYQTAVKGLLVAYYCEIVRHLDHGATDDGGSKRGLLSISKALEHMYQNYSDRLTVEFLAELCHLSVAQFRKVFTQIMKDAPLNFLNTIRVEKACTMLRATDKSTLSIAGQAGFNSYSSFHRYFTKIMGVSPKDYRASAVWPDINPHKKTILEYHGWL